MKIMAEGEVQSGPATVSRGTRVFPLGTLLVVALMSLSSADAVAQSFASVAAIESRVEVQRQGSWSDLGLGDTLRAGDSVRSDAQGRLRLVLSDGSVVVVASNSQLTLDAHLFNPAEKGGAKSVLTLLKGKIRALVSEYYRGGGSFDVQTPTAVSGVRGTDFVVLFDPLEQRSDIVGVSGRVSVRGVGVPGEVSIRGRELSVVRAAEGPRPAVVLSDEQFWYYLDGLDFVGGGRPESLIFNESILLNGQVPLSERADGLIDSDGGGLRDGDVGGGGVGLRRGEVGGRGSLDVDVRSEGAEAGAEVDRDSLDVDDRAPSVGWGGGFPWDEAELDVDGIPWEGDLLGEDAAGLGGEPGEALGETGLGIRF